MTGIYLDGVTVPEWSRAHTRKARSHKMLQGLQLEIALSGRCPDAWQSSHPLLNWEYTSTVDVRSRRIVGMYLDGVGMSQEGVDRG